MTLKDILPSRLGFGAAPLGNMFRDIPEQEAIDTVEAAWSEGIRYYDNAPFYGAGLAEIRMGEALARPGWCQSYETRTGITSSSFVMRRRQRSSCCVKDIGYISNKDRLREHIVD